MRIVTFFLLILGLCSCGMPANRPVDAFVWDRLCAHEDPDCVEPVGTCDADGFLAEMERFPWHEQAREALKLRKNSPTLSVSDLKSDCSLFISSAVDDNDRLGYFVGYVYLGEQGMRAPRHVNIYEVGQMEAIREMVILFFRRDEAALKRLVGEYLLYLETRDDTGWKKYLKMKQKFI